MLRTLKQLIHKYHVAEKSEDSAAFEHLYFLELEKKEIINSLQEHSLYFFTNAKDFQVALREIFSQHTRTLLHNLHLRTRVKNIETSNSKYSYHIKLIIEIKRKKENIHYSLPEFLIISKQELTDNDFNSNNFQISLLPILLSTKIQEYELIHKACWAIISNNINKNLIIN